MTAANRATGRDSRPFGIRDKVGYMFGDFGNNFTFLLQVMFFMLFYTNVVGISPEHVGLLLLVARIIDGFTDVGMGILVDRLPVKAGQPKFKRWIRAMAIPVAIASALMYMSFVADFGSYAMKVVWMCTTYFVWGAIVYTAINIPYGTMASVVSASPEDRTQLSVWRATGGVLASTVVMAVLPLLVYTTNAAGVSILDGPRMTIAAIVCSVLAVVCYGVCHAFVEERVPSVVRTRAEGGSGIGRVLGTVVTNRALLGLIVAALLLLLCSVFLAGMLGYLFLSYFGDGRLQSPASLAGMLPAIVLLVLGPWLSRRFGKAEVGALAMLLGGAVLVVSYFLKIQNPVVWIAFYAVAMFCVNIFNFLVWAFITDVIDFQEVRTGQRDDGTVYSVYSFARKLGQAFAGGLTGAALGWIGFNATAASQGLPQTATVNDGIYMLSNLIPGMGCILGGLALLFLYPLTKGRVEENVKILRERRIAEGLVP